MAKCDNNNDNDVVGERAYGYNSEKKNVIAFLPSLILSILPNYVIKENSILFLASLFDFEYPISILHLFDNYMS